MFEEMVGTSAALERALAQVAKVAPTDSTVLITGETGTGKALIAQTPISELGDICTESQLLPRSAEIKVCLWQEVVTSR